MVDPMVAADSPAQEIAEKQLLGKAHRVSLPLQPY
jgi:hypothetical protein